MTDDGRRTTEDQRQKTDDRRPTSSDSYGPGVSGLRSPVFRLRPRVSVPLLRSLFLPFLFIAVLLVGIGLAVEGDVVFKREGGEGGIPSTIFPHWFHRIRYKCYACHPTPFEMKAGANKITMDAIQEGKFCGACHNGKIAWAVTFETCNRCHVGK